MDLFIYNAEHRLWICKSCKTGVAPASIPGHLRSKRHRFHPTARTESQRVAVAEEAWKANPFNPLTEPFRPPAPISRPIPGLPVHAGYACPDCDSYAARSFESVRQHRRKTHGRRGRPGRPHQIDQRRTPVKPVSCQRFFEVGKACQFFTVTPETQARRASQALHMNEAEFVQSQVDEALRRSDGIAEVEDTIAPISSDVTETSPWLDLTQWPEYIRGHAFSDVARLALLPNPMAEPILVLVKHSVRRLIQLALESISSYQINEFDRVRLNSFVRRPGVWERPIQVKLRPSTYTRYQQVWVRLLSFVYRTSRPEHTLGLHH